MFFQQKQTAFERASSCNAEVVEHEASSVEQMEREMTAVAAEDLPELRPLWCVHLWSAPARHSMLLRVHHAIGDGIGQPDPRGDPHEKSGTEAGRKKVIMSDTIR